MHYCAHGRCRDRLIYRQFAASRSGRTTWSRRMTFEGEWPIKEGDHFQGRTRGWAITHDAGGHDANERDDHWRDHVSGCHGDGSHVDPGWSKDRPPSSVTKPAPSQRTDLWAPISTLRAIPVGDRKHGDLWRRTRIPQRGLAVGYGKGSRGRPKISRRSPSRSICRLSQEAT